ncbi:hypothetical protein [Risungbinella massiliensis]|nr:hypothetical protein [Risungbinella massiliensis]
MDLGKQETCMECGHHHFREGALDGFARITPRLKTNGFCPF